jgi:hypothetical protein
LDYKLSNHIFFNLSDNLSIDCRAGELANLLDPLWDTVKVGIIALGINIVTSTSEFSTGPKNSGMREIPIYLYILKKQLQMNFVLP